MIPQELIDRGQKVGISEEILEDWYKSGINPEYLVYQSERGKKISDKIKQEKEPLTQAQAEFIDSVIDVIKKPIEPTPVSSIKTTLIGNGFEVECPKIVGTNLADHLVSHKIEVYEIRFPFNKSHALIYGKLNPEVDIKEVVNSYSKEHGY